MLDDLFWARRWKILLFCHPLIVLETWPCVVWPYCWHQFIAICNHRSSISFLPWHLWINFQRSVNPLKVWARFVPLKNRCEGGREEKRVLPTKESYPDSTRHWIFIGGRGPLEVKLWVEEMVQFHLLADLTSEDREISAASSSFPNTALPVGPGPKL